MKTHLVKLFLFVGLIGMWLTEGSGLAQSLNNQLQIMQVNSVAGRPELNEVFLSALGPYPNHFLIDELTADNFTVYENDKEVPISDLSSVNEGIAVVILIDRSGSMREGGIEKPELRIDSARQAALDLVNRLDPATDLVGLIGFHDEIGPVLELTPDTGAARNLLSGDRLSAEDDRNTALYLSTYQALDWLIDNPDPALREQLQHKRKAVLLFTDGRDTEGGIAPGDVRDRALKFNIPVYTVGVDTGEWDPTIVPGLEAEFEDAEWIARTTDARFLRLKTTEEREQLYQFFEGLVSQGVQYRLTYYTQADQKTNTLRIVLTTTGDAEQVMEAEDRFEFSGRLKLPEIQITDPSDDLELDLALNSEIVIEVNVSFPDDIERPLERIEYYASGTLIGSATSPYTLTWDAEGLDGGEYTLIARGYDSILEEAGSFVSDNQVTVNIIEPPPPPTATPVPPPTPTFQARAISLAKSNFLAILLIPVILILFFLLLITRRQLAQGVRTVATTATGVLKGVTRQLGSSPAYAKLIITKGGNIGREFKIDAQIVKVGRDPQYCDFATHDQYSSNPNFTIVQGPGPTFYIQDDHSRNGTYLNGQRLTPGQQYPLPFGSAIRLGRTELAFKQLGGPTRRIPRPTQKVP